MRAFPMISVLTAILRAKWLCPPCRGIVPKRRLTGLYDLRLPARHHTPAPPTA